MKKKVVKKKVVKKKATKKKAKKKILRRTKGTGPRMTILGDLE